jgi:amino acid transporter
VRSRSSPPQARHGAGLQRTLGRWDLTAIGVNQVIGTSVFLMPAQIAALVGGWGPLAVLAGGLATLAVGLCFAEAGSRFEGTGGPYLYTRAAFGRFASFEVGWLAWFTRCSSQAAVTAGLTLAVGRYAPALAVGWGRASLVAAVTLLFGAVTWQGIRQSAWVVNTLTIGKLLPLAIFLAAGLAWVSPSRLPALAPVGVDDALAAGLMLIFLYGGFEVVGVPAGEARDPRRHVPFALVSTVTIVTVLFSLSQLTVTAILPDLARSGTPLADAAQISLGAAGALFITVGSLLAMAGNIAGQVLSGSRYLYALGEQGDLPRWFAFVHPRHHTPTHAVAFTSAIALALALTGSFAALAALAAVARLLVYAGTCGATLALRSDRWLGRAAPATFTVPGGPLVPVLGIVVSLAVGAGATRTQLTAGLAFLALGGVLFAVARARS